MVGRPTALAVKAAMSNPGTCQDGDGLFLKIDERDVLAERKDRAAPMRLSSGLSTAPSLQPRVVHQGTNVLVMDADAATVSWPVIAMFPDRTDRAGLAWEVFGLSGLARLGRDR